MATRLYLGRKSFSIIDPGVLGAWDFSYRQRYGMFNSKQSTALATSTITGVSATQKTLMRQYISPPMQAGITFDYDTDDWIYLARYQQSSLAMDTYPAIFLSLTNSVGVPRGFNLSLFGAGVGGTEFATSLSARGYSHVAGTSSGTSSITTNLGDRWVLEVGWYKSSGPSVSGSVGINLGDNAANDLSGVGDTGADNPYLETSVNITFVAEGSLPTDGDKYELTSYISGVLDDYI